MNVRRTGLLAILLLACSSATGPADELELRTPRPQYAPWDTITLTIRNRTAEHIYVSHCDHRISLRLQKRVDGAWVEHLQVNGPWCQAIYAMGETAVPAGEEIVQQVHFGETGEFRFGLYGRRASEDFGSLQAFSPPFVVTYPPD